ncbi:nuclear cap-binding protein subunit 1 [Tanacetum coccineum]|uniref:Nuclear cap-binding protein subunit 1 n=1 Tax=Tanacetum coccineum TaxID=301880 RepID=A0ABQ5CBL4_9ASTR
MGAKAKAAAKEKASNEPQEPSDATKKGRLVKKSSEAGSSNPSNEKVHECIPKLKGNSRGAYHRDLKPDNLLLEDEGNLKWLILADVNTDSLVNKDVSSNNETGSDVKSDEQPMLHNSETKTEASAETSFETTFIQSFLDTLTEHNPSISTSNRKQIVQLKKSLVKVEKYAAEAQAVLDGAESKLMLVDGEPVVGENSASLVSLPVQKFLQCFNGLHDTFVENSLEPIGDSEAMAVDGDDTHAMETDKENGGSEINAGTRYIIGEKEQWCLLTLGYFKAFSRQYASETYSPTSRKCTWPPQFETFIALMLPAREHECNGN